ncbi:hypothetical protein OHA37_12240 [Streptomyces sp. NBC_00335]|uniref:hypothetical protein n=1 Tax=unclassified Streptomyces TaxID=2593676 RepID=UPI002250BD4D|nr:MULTISPECIES: hypothetical protein [unclassified Streptomyces]MCX5404650.1 hypothetical protein [Streptomyces sp. NBC_00086]
MKAVTGTRALAVALLLGGMTLTACSDPGTPGGDETGAAEVGSRSVEAYTTCMDGQGVKVIDGKARTDDGVDAARLGKAYRACRAVAPADVQVPVTQWELSLLTEFVTCMRGKGHKEYGDPDPRTGTYAMPKDSEIDKEAELACLAAAEQRAGK